MDDLYDNVIHFAIECIMSAYLAKECDKGLKREFGAHEVDRNLMQEDYTRLKARVTKVENTMKETLESMDNLQADFSGILISVSGLLFSLFFFWQTFGVCIPS